MESTQQKERSWQRKPLLGVLLMIAGLALYPLSDAFVKHLMGTYSVYQTAFLRGATRAIPLLIAVLFQGGFSSIFRTQHKGLHAVRLGVNLLYTYAFMFSFSVYSLTMVYTLSYTSSFFMIIFGALFLREAVSKEKWIAVGLGMGGILLALKPGMDLFTLASFVILSGTVLGALNKVLMRKLAKTEHSLAITVYPNLSMMLVTLPFLLTAWHPMPWVDWGLFLIVGLITALAQYLVAQALRFAEASTLAPVDYSSFLWVLSLDFLWWGTSPALSVLLGALLIIGSNIYIIYITKKKECLPSPNTET